MIHKKNLFYTHAPTQGIHSLEEREKMIKIARLQMAWDRAAASVFNTSLTTVIAFASLTVSDLPFMAAFGGFIALMIFNLFLMTIIGFPAVLAVFYEYLVFKQNKCCCCLNCCCAWSPCCPAPYGAFKSRPETDPVSGEVIINADGTKVQKPEYFVPLRFVNEEEEEAYNNSLDPSTMGESQAFVKFYKMLTHFEWVLAGGPAPTAADAKPAGETKKATAVKPAAGFTEPNAVEDDRASKEELEIPKEGTHNMADADADVEGGAGAGTVDADPTKGTKSGKSVRVRETQAAPLGADEIHYQDPDDLAIKKFYAIPCAIIVVFQLVAFVHMYWALQMGELLKRSCTCTVRCILK